MPTGTTTTTTTIRTKSRKAAMELPRKLANLLQTTKFQCSIVFQTADFCVDDDQPLDVVTFDKRTLRYQVAPTSNFCNDDAILQAMVMLFLISKNHYGWGWDETLRQLGTWSNPRKPSFLEGPNLWKTEMDTAIANNKELSTSMLGHRDYYSSMDNFFSSSKPARQRRSKGFMRSKLHEITEQACIQWALQEQQQESRPLTEAAVLILKLFWREQQQQDNNNTNNSNDDNKKLNAAAKAVSTILWEEGEKDNEETFLKRIMERMESLW